MAKRSVDIEEFYYTVVFTKQEWNRQKICPKSEIETDKTDNHYFKIHAARKIAQAERHRNYGRILYQTLCFC
ncbi:hypothetical protein [Bartonella grahamii]|uniref:hypothetical protein n=1 Tax=Bartonella grahamii TaxID=33045 RepID=UPI002E7AD149|nr:hypothetical protein [Bartonella grahamii]